MGQALVNQDKQDKTDKAAQAAEEKKKIAQVRAALAVLGLVQPQYPHAPEGYRLNRCGRQVLLAPADFERLGQFLADPEATLADARAALAPFAQIPDDYRVEDPTQAIFGFPTMDGKQAYLKNPDIHQLHAAWEAVV